MHGVEAVRSALASVDRRELAILGGVVVGALALRLAGAFFGLPHVFHPDEGAQIYRALRLGIGDGGLDAAPAGGYRAAGPR